MNQVTNRFVYLDKQIKSEQDQTKKKILTDEYINLLSWKKWIETAQIAQDIIHFKLQLQLIKIETIKNKFLYTPDLIFCCDLLLELESLRSIDYELLKSEIYSFLETELKQPDKRKRAALTQKQRYEALLFTLNQKNCDIVDKIYGYCDNIRFLKT